MLSYFGCDQSQVQRYLTAKSVQEGRHSLMMSAYREDSAPGARAAHRRAGVRLLPVQPAADAVPAGGRREDPEERARPASWRRSNQSSRRRSRRAGRRRRRWPKPANGDGCGSRGVPRGRRTGSPNCGAVRPALAREVGEASYKDFTGDTPTPDVNYVFPTFVTTRLPMGLVGLDHRRDLRRRDVEHCGGAELAGDRRR